MTRRATLLGAALALLLPLSADAQELELRWSSARAFVHEQVQLEAVVVHPVGLNPRWEAPPFDGFVVERLPSEGGTMRRSEAGSYVRTTRLRHALFPTRSGVIAVAPSRIVFVDQSGRETFLAVPDSRLTVDGLPEAGRPPGFDAAVGTLSVRATLTPRSIALGEHADLELEVFGSANVWDVAAPDLEAAFGPACEVFTEPPHVDRTLHDDQFFARKTFRFSLVPGAQGRLAIPALEVAHFDPATAAYRVARTDPLDLEVRPARAPAPPPRAAAAAAEPAQDPGAIAWLPSALLVASALVVGLRLRRGRPPEPPVPRPASEPPRARSRAAPEDLLRHAAESLEEPGFGALLSRALRTACAPDDASLTTRELAARTPDAELVALLRAIDSERFSGRSSLEERRALLDAAVAYLRRTSEA